MLFWRKPKKVGDDRREKAEATFNKAKDLFDKGEIDAAISMSHAARDLYESTKDTEGLGRAENLIGDILRSIGQFDFAEKAYQRATVAFKSTEGDAESFMELGEVHQFQDERDEAIAAYEKALSLYRRLNDKPKIAQLTRSIAYLLYEKEQWVEAEKYYRDALELAEQTQMQDLKDSIILEIGNAIAHQGRLNEARRLFEQSAAQARATNDPDTLADALHSLAITYVAEGNRQRASELYAESLALNQQSNDRAGVAYTLFEMGVNEAEAGDRPKGRDLIQQAMTIYEELGAPELAVAKEKLAQYA
ncbi:MAG: tetratricopeptide repeat protein [Anaerolineae bacterium]|nr:tetratricopeptide repeat protein [Anaerolineae bacterium]